MIKGWMARDFLSCSVFKSCQDDGRKIMKRRLQWNRSEPSLFFSSYFFSLGFKPIQDAMQRQNVPFHATPYIYACRFRRAPQAGMRRRNFETTLK